MISASLYSSDCLDLRKSVKDAEMFGAESLHVDIMDGNYVAEFGLNLKLIKSVGKIAKLPIDIHFMTHNPSSFFDNYITPHVRNVFFHHDTEQDIEKSLRHIRDKGAGPGIAFSPDADLESLRECYKHCKSILLMSIDPGTEQSFRETVFDRIKYLNDLRRSKQILFNIAVDGGLDLNSARKCLTCGADEIVLGRALFQAAAPADLVRDLNIRNILKQI